MSKTLEERYGVLIYECNVRAARYQAEKDKSKMYHEQECERAIVELIARVRELEAQHTKVKEWESLQKQNVIELPTDKTFKLRIHGINLEAYVGNIEVFADYQCYSSAQITLICDRERL